MTVVNGYKLSYNGKRNKVGFKQLKIRYTPFSRPTLMNFIFSQLVRKPRGMKSSGNLIDIKILNLFFPFFSYFHLFFFSTLFFAIDFKRIDWVT